MVEALEEEHERLNALSVNAEEEFTIRAPLTLSYRALPDPAARLYRLLGLYPGATFDSRVAAAMAGISRHAARRELGILTDANLLDDAPGGRYRFHDLTRLHARETALAEEPEDSRRAALQRVVRWTLHAAGAASRAAAPYRRIPLEGPGPHTEPVQFPDSATALDWLDVEFRNLRAVAQWAADNGLPEPAWRLVDAVWPLFLHRGHRAERLGFDRIGLRAARECGDLEGEAKMLNRTGLAFQAGKDFEAAAADFRSALDLWTRLGSVHRVAGTRRRLGSVELQRGDHVAALALFEAALEGYRASGERRREGRTLCDVGRALIAGDRPAAAAAALDQARAILATADDPFNHAQALVLLGRARLTTPLALEGLAEMRRIGSRTGEATVLLTLAEITRLTGKDDEARRYDEEYRRVVTELDGSGG